MGFPHLRAVAAVETEAQQPRPLTVVYLKVTRFAFFRILTCDSRFTVEIEVSGHPGMP